MRSSFLSLLSSITLLVPTVLSYGDQCLDFPDYLHTKRDLLDFCSTKYPIPAKTVTLAASPVTRTEIVISTAGANATTALFTARPQNITSTATIFTTETETIVELSTSTDIQTEIDVVTETQTETSTSVSLGSTVVPFTTVGGTTTSFSTVTLTIFTDTTIRVTTTRVLTATTTTTTTSLTTSTRSTSTTTYTDYKRKRDVSEDCKTYEVTRTLSMVITHDAVAPTPCPTCYQEAPSPNESSSKAAGPQKPQIEHTYPSSSKPATSSVPAYPSGNPVDDSSDSNPEPNPSKYVETSDESYAYPTVSKEGSPARPHPTASKQIVSSGEDYAYLTASKEVYQSEEAYSSPTKHADVPEDSYPYPEGSKAVESSEKAYSEKTTSKKGEGYPRPTGYNTASISHRPFFPSISTGGSGLPSASSKPIPSKTYEPYPQESEDEHPEEEPEDEYPESEEPYPEESEDEYPEEEYPVSKYPEEEYTAPYPRPTGHNTASLSHRPYFPSISTGGSRLPSVSRKPSLSRTYVPYPEQTEEPYPGANITSLCSCLGKTPTLTIYTTAFVNRTLTSIVYSTPVTNRTVTPTLFNTVSNTATIRVFRTGTSVVPRRTTTTVSVFTTTQTTSVQVEQSTVTSTSTVFTTTTAVQVVETPITATSTTVFQTITTTRTSTITQVLTATSTTTVVAVETIYPHGFVCSGGFCPQPRGGFCDARASGQGGACTDNSFNCNNPCTSDLQCPIGQACVAGFPSQFCGGRTICAPVTQ